MSLIDLFKGFHREAIQQEFTPSTRVLFDTLIYKLNDEFWPDELVLSERELIRLTGLPKTTINRAKQFLASRHFIKITNFKNKTAYSLDDEMAKLVRTTNGPTADQSRTGSGPVADRFSRSTTLFPIAKTQDSRQKTVDGACTRESGKNEGLSTESDVYDLWEYETGYNLTGSIAYELETLERKYGRESFHAALKTAVASNNRGRVTFKFFKAVLENQMKEADKSESKPYDYAKPKDDSDEWRKYLEA